MITWALNSGFDLIKSYKNLIGKKIEIVAVIFTTCYKKTSQNHMNDSAIVLAMELYYAWARLST